MNSRTLAGVLGAALVAGVTSAQTTQAVEWKVSEGGNGHWYASTLSWGSWSQTRSVAQSIGGDLACISDVNETAFLCGTVLRYGNGNAAALWIGLRLDGGVWSWLSGESLSYTHWEGSNPGGGEDRGWVFGSNHPIVSDCSWNDAYGEAHQYPGLVEWSADCNGDGIVDYGQILRGEFEDLNVNGVPDICETSISSVLPPSVPAQGGSTVTIRGNGFPANPTVLIGGVPATNVLRESATRITATSPATLPGMASVSVNDFTLADGIYIRPECGSDLDQNGEVDAGDIAIILLDFGPCYSTPTLAQPEDSRPFMLREEPLVEAPNRK